MVRVVNALNIIIIISHLLLLILMISIAMCIQQGQMLGQKLWCDIGLLTADVGTRDHLSAGYTMPAGAFSLVGTLMAR